MQTSGERDLWLILLGACLVDTETRDKWRNSFEVRECRKQELIELFSPVHAGVGKQVWKAFEKYKLDATKEKVVDAVLERLKQLSVMRDIADAAESITMARAGSHHEIVMEAAKKISGIVGSLKLDY